MLTQIIESQHPLKNDFCVLNVVKDLNEELNSIKSCEKIVNETKISDNLYLIETKDFKYLIIHQLFNNQQVKDLLKKLYSYSKNNQLNINWLADTAIYPIEYEVLNNDFTFFNNEIKPLMNFNDIQYFENFVKEGLIGK